tara:strand:- start:194 stop:313 length:120 start_codon:yes stop_codon:yes gene_type:complete
MVGIHADGKRRSVQTKFRYFVKIGEQEVFSDGGLDKKYI